MNKVELVASISEKSGFSKKDSEKALSAMLDSIVEAVGNNEKVQLIGFGTFESRERSARTGLNPQTKKPINIPATTVPVFKAGKAFKEAVAK